MDDREVRERVAHAEDLLAAIEDDQAATDAVAAVVELYGEALRRIATRVELHEVVDDELVRHMLLVHDLHPDDVETRVRTALDDVRPYLGAHGGDVELLGVDNGIVRLRLNGTCNGCPSSRVTLQNAIEEAVLRAAPEIAGVDAEGVAEPPSAALLQIGRLECPTELQTA